MRRVKNAYKQKFGKIVHNLSLPVDGRMKMISQEAKRRKFKFNEWARDVLYDRIQEVVRECDIEIPEDN